MSVESPAGPSTSQFGALTNPIAAFNPVAVRSRVASQYESLRDINRSSTSMSAAQSPLESSSDLDTSQSGAGSRTSNNLLSLSPLLGEWVNEPERKINAQQAKHNFADYFINHGGVETNGCLVFPDTLEITDSDLKSLPSNLIVQGHCNLLGASQLKSISTGLSVHKNLTINQCTKLTHMEDNISVYGDLKINYCLRLTTLGNAMKVGGFSLISNSGWFDSLPDDLQANGPIYLLNLARFASLPAQLLTQNESRELILNIQPPAQSNIFVCNCDLSSHNYQAAQPEHINDQIEETATTSFSERRLIIATSGWRSSDRRFDTVNDAYDFWCGLSLTANQLPVALDLAWMLDDEQIQFSHYAYQFIHTADFTDNGTMQLLAQRMVHLMQFMADQPAEFTFIQEQISHALNGCSDRVAQSLSQIETNIFVHQASQALEPRKALYDLAIGLIKLDSVHKSAFAQLSVEEELETAERLLAFETVLKDELNLPILNSRMIYDDLVDLSPLLLRETVNSANAAAGNQSTIDEFLDHWSPWQKLLRNESVQGLNYSQLPATGQPHCIDQICPLTQELLKDLAEPVVIAGQNTVFEMQPLLQWWAHNGTDPLLGTNFNLDQLNRAILQQATQA